MSPSDQLTIPSRRRCCRKLDRSCCAVFAYTPLLFVYGLTTWAVWVEAWSISLTHFQGKSAIGLALVGVLLYLMTAWSYTVAVVTSPGSPVDVPQAGKSQSYSRVPLADPEGAPSQGVTVKSAGGVRFCKKCQSHKPDRTHHCSTCGTCILKMDHHCPWLATCIGFRNYKAFLLFLIYCSIFALYCGSVAGYVVYFYLFDDSNRDKIGDLAPVNWVLLAVIGLIIGIVLVGFAAWHVSLVLRNLTTIEAMEKTRYLAPGIAAARQGAFPPGAHPFDLEAQTRPNIDFAPPSPPHSPSRPSRNSLESSYHYRARLRNLEYSIEQYSAQLPHAFDIGASANWRQVMGSNIVLWFLPVRLSGQLDGWNWEVSDRFKLADAAAREERLAQADRDAQAGSWENHPDPGPTLLDGSSSVHGQESEEPAEPSNIAAPLSSRPQQHTGGRWVPANPSGTRATFSAAAPSIGRMPLGLSKLTPGFDGSSKAERLLGVRGDVINSNSAAGVQLRDFNLQNRSVGRNPSSIHEIDYDSDDDTSSSRSSADQQNSVPESNRLEMAKEYLIGAVGQARMERNAEGMVGGGQGAPVLGEAVGAWGGWGPGDEDHDEEWVDDS